MPPIKKILMDKNGKRFFVRDTANDYHCQFGLVKKADLKKKAGTEVTTNTGKKFTIFAPQFIDMYTKIKRGPQIIPRKDIGFIIAETGINKNSVCLEAGGGSGGLTLQLANIAKKIYTYELREDFYEIVKKNIESAGFKNVVLKNADVTKEVKVKNVDLVVLDLPTPWEALPTVLPALKVGGFLVSYSPTTPQVSDFVEAARRHISILKTVEITEREWEVEQRKVRPKSQSIGHSGFLTLCRKI